MKYLKLLFLALIVTGMAACNDKDDDDEKDDDPVVATYVGKLEVDQNDGTKFEQENVSMKIKIEEGTADIDMSQVSFSEKMLPIRIDMTIPNITATKTSAGYTLSGNNIIPIAMGGEFPNYTIKNMTGTVTGETIAFEMMCGEYPLSFSGTVKK